jgi:hypothetical protein
MTFGNIMSILLTKCTCSKQTIEGEQHDNANVNAMSGTLQIIRVGVCTIINYSRAQAINYRVQNTFIIRACSICGIEMKTNFLPSFIIYGTRIIMSSKYT